MVAAPRDADLGPSSDRRPIVSADDKRPADERRRAGTVVSGPAASTYLPAGAKCRRHVNRHMIKADKKDGGRRPVLTAKRRGRTATGSGCRIPDDDGRVVARMVYRPDRPLSCGAHAWIETDHHVVVA
jgi:hypothetical protein